jgi:hypothetical protein
LENAYPVTLKTFKRGLLKVLKGAGVSVFLKSGVWARKWS